MSLLQIADSTGKMNYVCSSAAKHELEPVEISAHCVLFHRKPGPSGPLVAGTVQRPGGSCRFGKGQVGVGYPVKSMPKPSTERSVVDSATNLEQQIGAFSRPSHLPGLVHGRLTRKFAVPSVIDVPTRRSARNRLA